MASAIFRKYKIHYTWETILVGRKLNLINDKSIEQFAIEYLFNNPQCSNMRIVQLASEANASELDILLNKIIEDLNINISDPKTYERERIKWRYCILKYLNDAIQDSTRLLEEIEKVYSTFGYPDDMVEFIYYMPPQDISLYDPSQHTYEENCKRLISKFHIFLKNEEKNILNKYVNPASLGKIDN